MSEFLKQHEVSNEQLPWAQEPHIDNGPKCSQCGAGWLHWRQIPTDTGKLHWRLFNENGQRHSCYQVTSPDRLNDGI